MTQRASIPRAWIAANAGLVDTAIELISAERGPRHAAASRQPRAPRARADQRRRAQEHGVCHAFLGAERASRPPRATQRRTTGGSPPRPERHFRDSLVTIRLAFARAIARWLPRCPVCHTIARPPRHGPPRSPATNLLRGSDCSRINLDKRS